MVQAVAALGSRPRLVGVAQILAWGNSYHQIHASGRCHPYGDLL
jgi:hypothetical protein